MNMAFGNWENYPFYTGPCADVDGCYDRRGNSDRCCRREQRYCGQDERNMCSGMFVSYLPMAIAANGIIPLVVNNPCRDSSFDVNSGLITLERQGTYLATYNVRIPEGATVDTTMTLNVDDASQTCAATQIVSGGTDTSAYSAQAIFQADEGATVSLRSSDAISIADPSAQPMFTLSLVQLTD